DGPLPIRMPSSTRHSGTTLSSFFSTPSYSTTLPPCSFLVTSLKAPGLGFSGSVQPVRSLPLKSCIQPLPSSFLSSAPASCQAVRKVNAASTANGSNARFMKPSRWNVCEFNGNLSRPIHLLLGHLSGMGRGLGEVGRDVGFDVAGRPRQAAEQ